MHACASVWYAVGKVSVPYGAPEMPPRSWYLPGAWPISPNSESENIDMTSMPPSPATFNPPPVAIRHLFVWFDACGTAWGVGTTPDFARSSAASALTEAVTEGDASAGLDEQLAGGFVIGMAVPATLPAKVLATALMLDEQTAAACGVLLGAA